MSKELFSLVFKIVDEFKSSNIKSFYASAILELIESKKDKKSIESELIKILYLLAEQGIFEKRYIIFNPENPREKKIYDSEDSIPINDVIEFDFNDVFIDSLDDSLIEVFFTFENNDTEDMEYRVKDIKRQASLVKNGGLSDAFMTKSPPSASEKGIDKNATQINVLNYIINGDVNMNNHTGGITQNFSDNNITQAAAQLANNNSNIQFENNQIFEKIKELIDQIEPTNNEVLDKKITELKDDVSNKRLNLDTLKIAMTNLTDIAKATSIVIPVADKIMNLLTNS